MRRYGNLYDSMVNKDNLKLAFNKAKKRGKKTPSGMRIVRRIEDNPDHYIDKLHELLLSGNYRTSPYTTKVIYEPKERKIFILPFYPDRIVHHAIMNILEPIWDSVLDSGVYSCRKGKGQHAGSTYCMELTMKYSYCLKCDVSKFYPSINHAVLKQIIRRKIKDVRMLSLLDEIIDSPGGETNCPIGNLLSQWMGNIYLNEMDDIVRHRLHCSPFVRYCDDFILFDNDKERLFEWRAQIGEFLSEVLKLRYSKADIFPTARGVDFLGYRHFPEGYILVRKSTAKRQKKIIEAIPYEVGHGIITPAKALAQIDSANGIFKHANAHKLTESLKMSELREEILRNEAFQRI